MRWRYLVAAVVAVLMSGVAVSAQPSQAPSMEHARMLFDAGKMAEARQELAALARSGATDPQVFLLLGVAERTQGDLTRAIATLKQGQALAPDSIQLSMELATTLAWNRNLDEAIALFRQVLTRAPGDLGARIGLAFALAWQGRREDARSIFAALVDEDPRNVSGWLGLGFVARASLRRADAIEHYQHVLEIDPANAEAIAALKEVHWDARGEWRALGGLSAEPDVPSRGEARADVRYAATPQLSLNGGYQHYAFGAVSAITGGGFLFDIRTEDSLEGGFVYRPSDRTSIGATLYSFFSEDVNRGMVWVEGVVGLTSRISLIANVRPAFSDSDPAWLWAGAAGASVSLPHKQALSARVLVAADTTYEPKLTFMGNYDFAPARRFALRLGVAHSSTDEQFKFTSVAAGATYLVTPSVGLSIDATTRTGTFERTTFLAGVVLRR